jgi:hypothetical protein
MLPCVLEMLEQLASHDLEAAKALDIERRRQGVISTWAPSEKDTSIRSMAWHFMNQRPSLKKVVHQGSMVGEECVQFEGTACTWLLFGRAIAWWSESSFNISPGWREEDAKNLWKALSTLDNLLPLVLRRLNRIPGLHVYERKAFYAFQKHTRADPDFSKFYIRGWYHSWGGSYTKRQPFIRKGTRIPEKELVTESHSRGLYRTTDW